MTNPLNRNNLSKATAAGVVLAVGGVILFIVLWDSLGRAGWEAFPRLIVSMCFPPAVIAAIMGGYILLVRPGKPKQ
jgi:formate/nitrite transporter FocA (FNT family)